MHFASADIYAVTSFRTVGIYCSKLVKVDLTGVAVTQSSLKLLSERCSAIKVCCRSHSQLLVHTQHILYERTRILDRLL